MEQESIGQSIESSGGINLRRVRSNAGTSRHGSGASFAQDLRGWWWSTQRQFGKQSDVEAYVGVQAGTFGHWMAGITFPSDPLCDRLYALTGLRCFSAEGRKAARLEHEQKRGLSRAAIRKREQRQYVTPEELAECRVNPEKAFTIRGDEWLVCLECGQMLKQIRDRGSAAHLKEHGISNEQYRMGPDPKNPRYGKNRGIICNARLAELSEEARRTGRLVPDRERKYLRSPQTGRKMPPEFSHKLAARMRGKRNSHWAKDVPDVDFIWPWIVDGKPLGDVAKLVGFSIGGVWARLKTIIGTPVRKAVKDAPHFSAVERAARALDESGSDDAKLKAGIERLCGESRSEVAAKNARGDTGVAILVIPRMRSWRAQVQQDLSYSDAARRFLAERAWVVRRVRKPKRPRKHGPDKLPANETAWYKAGREIEELIARAVPLRDARRRAADAHRYDYGTAVRHHLKYRKYKTSQTLTQSTHDEVSKDKPHHP